MYCVSISVEIVLAYLTSRISFQCSAKTKSYTVGKIQKILRTFNRKSGSFLINVLFVIVVTADSAFIPSIMFCVNRRYLKHVIEILKIIAILSACDGFLDAIQVFECPRIVWCRPERIEVVRWKDGSRMRVSVFNFC